MKQKIPTGKMIEETKTICLCDKCEKIITYSDLHIEFDNTYSEYGDTFGCTLDFCSFKCINEYLLKEDKCSYSMCGVKEGVIIKFYTEKENEYNQIKDMMLLGESK